MLTRIIVMLLLAFFSILELKAGELRVFTSKDSNINKLSIETIRNLYLGREKFVDSHLVRVADCEKSQQAFLENYINKDKKSYTGLWRMMVFTGKARAPKFFEKPTSLADYVAQNKNTIAYTTEKVDLTRFKVIEISH